MLSLILSIALVAAPSPHVAPGVGQPPMFNPAQLDDAGLSANAFRVFGRVCRRWTRERGCYETKPNMAAGCRMGEAALFSALNELESRRFIVRSGRGPAARIDWLPPSEWLDEPAEFTRDEGANGSPGSEGCTPEVHPDPGGEVTPDPGGERSPGSEGCKGYPPKGIHKGSSSEKTTTDGDEEADPDAEGVVVLSGDGLNGPQPRTARKPADPDREAKNAAWVLLRERGVEADAATALADEHWRSVPDVVERYDAGWEAGDIAGPGWLVKTIPSYVPPKPNPAKQAATHVGRTPEAERGVAKTQELRREDAAGRPRQSAEVPDWRTEAEEERRRERARLDAVARPSRRRSSLRDLPTAPVAGAEPAAEEVAQPQDS